MINFQKVTKKFGNDFLALSDINITIDKGEFVFLTGSTGSGKTTLLRLLIRDLLPTSGKVVLGDWDITKLPHHKIPHLRRRVGIIFQDLKLLMDRTLFENVALTLEVAGFKKVDIKRRVDEVLSQVKLSDHLEKFPLQLSGGELQRAAVARALILKPEVLLADEPTGNLDMDTSWGIIGLIKEINATGTTILMATHNIELVEKLKKRVISLNKGRIIKDDKKDKNGTS